MVTNLNDGAIGVSIHDVTFHRDKLNRSGSFTRPFFVLGGAGIQD